MRNIYKWALVILLFTLTIESNAQDNTESYPFLLQKAYFGIDAGSLYYPFSNKNLALNFSAQTIMIPREAVRLTLFGYRFTKKFSARITYMRPVQWVLYKNVNGDHLKHSVWMNIGGFTAKQNIVISNRFSLFAEGGFALITRKGFTIDSTQVLKDIIYPTISIGGGAEYRLNEKWCLNLYYSYSPGKDAIKQPKTVFAGGGFTYNMNTSAQQISMNQTDKKIFPKQMLQLSYTTNTLGYGVNNFFAEGKLPVFWGGLAKVEQGFAINYTRNIFHSKKTFALDVGTSIGSWESRNKDQSFYAVSVYPVLRFTVIRGNATDFYFFYSVAGPSFISRTQIDDENTGRHFTFRDFMGIGGYIGHQKLLNTEISIGHFSNGNLFPDNAAVKIPLSFSIGYSF